MAVYHSAYPVARVLPMSKRLNSHLDSMQTSLSTTENMLFNKNVVERIEFQPYILLYHVLFSLSSFCMSLWSVFPFTLGVFFSPDTSDSYRHTMLQTAMKIFQLILFHFCGNKTFIIFFCVWSYLQMSVISFN